MSPLNIYIMGDSKWLFLAIEIFWSRSRASVRIPSPILKSPICLAGKHCVCFQYGVCTTSRPFRRYMTILRRPFFGLMEKHDWNKLL